MAEGEKGKEGEGRNIDRDGGHRPNYQHRVLHYLDGRDTKSFRFDNTKEGFEKFWFGTMACKNRFGCDEVVVGY